MARFEGRGDMRMLYGRRDEMCGPDGKWNAEANAALAAPAHEMVACVTALVQAAHEFDGEHPIPCPAAPDCWLDNANAALADLAKAWGVEAR